MINCISLGNKEYYIVVVIVIGIVIVIVRILSHGSIICIVGEFDGLGLCFIFCYGEFAGCGKIHKNGLT